MKNTRENALKFVDEYGKKGFTTSELLVKYVKKISKDAVTVQQVLEMLRRARFERWYTKDFVDFIGEQPEAKSKKEILKDLRAMLLNISC